MLTRIFLVLSSLFFIAACSDSGSGDSPGTNTSTYEFNGKSPEEFFAQFYIEVLNCDEADKSKWLKKASAIDSSISSIIDVGNGNHVSIDLMLTESRYKMEVEILKKSSTGGFTNIVSHEVLGIVTLVDGQLELASQDGPIAILTHGMQVNDEDTMVLELTDSYESTIDTDFYEMMKPVIGKKMMVKNVRASLTTSETTIGCKQGAEALVFE